MSGLWDKTIKLWDLKINECILTLKDHNGPVLCLIELNSTNAIVISGSDDKSLKLWNIKNKKMYRVFIRAH